MFQGTGRVVAGKELQKFSRARPWWMILQCDTGMMQYYQWFIENSEKDVWGRSVHKICWPLAHAHISIVRGEEPRAKEPWNSLIGTRLTFEYTNNIQTNGKHWWLPVKCEDVYQLRNSLGLKPIPKFPLHLTIAVNVEWEKKSS